MRLRETVIAARVDRPARPSTTCDLLGVETDDVRVDYPDVAREVGDGDPLGRAERGVLVCGSGVGASIAASKIPGSAPRSATTPTPPTRASSTTT